MHPLAYEHLRKVLADKKLVGPRTDCEYYPCHFMGQDCTWCFCPFYPCEEPQTGGEWITRRDGTSVWSCMYCHWIHRREVAEALLNKLCESWAGAGIERVEEEDIERVSRRIFLDLKDEYPPTPPQRQSEI